MGFMSKRGEVRVSQFRFLLPLLAYTFAPHLPNPSPLLSSPPPLTSLLPTSSAASTTTTTTPSPPPPLPSLTPYPLPPY